MRETPGQVPVTGCGRWSWRWVLRWVQHHIDIGEVSELVLDERVDLLPRETAKTAAEGRDGDGADGEAIEHDPEVGEVRRDELDASGPWSGS